MAEDAGEGVEVDIMSIAAERGDCISKVWRFVPRIDFYGNLTLSLRRVAMMVFVVMVVVIFIFKTAYSLQSRVLTMCRI